MGNAAKIVLVGAASLIVGVYGISLKTVQSTDLQTALSHTTLVQNERAEDAAVRTALERVTRAPLLGKSSTTGTYSALGGGTFSFTYTTHTTWGTATLTMNQSGDTKIIDVTMAKQSTTNPGFRHLVRGQWQVTKYHVRSLY